MTDLSQWTEFGLPGMIIAALFVLVGVVVKWLTAHLDTQAAAHRDERKEWRMEQQKTVERQATEREQWRTSIDRSVDEFTRAVRELSKGH